MNVMNIKHYLSAVAALGLLAACSEYDPGMSDQAVDLTDAEIETIEEYTANFINRYGEPAKDHTWGFGAKGSEDEMGTRAVQVDRNQWVVAVKDNNNVVVDVATTVGTSVQGDGYTYYDYTTKEGYIIPGFPSAVDGKYYIEENNQQVGYTKEQILSKMQNSQVQPAGDVTDEEIEYVSWWFRTHPNITSETPPFTEYFVQDISQDQDRVSYPNGEWKDESGGQRMVPVYLYQNGTLLRQDGTTNISYGMDYFSVKTHESDGTDFWEHNNDLNKQKANQIAESGGAVAATATNTTPLASSTTHYANRTLKYWTSEGPSQNVNGLTVYKNGEGYTTSFSYHNSDDNADYDKYVLVHLQFKGPRTGLDYDGWYLAFDYELHKVENLGNNQVKKIDVKPDGYYSNWILKLSPGNPEFYENHTWHRVMCEDLGSTDDYDFNDLVFDVYFTGTDNQYTAHIKVQAAGGTLPIYVGTHTEDISREAHQILQGGNAKKMGTSLYQPVNVAAGISADPVEITFEMKDASGNWLTGAAGTDPDNIPILVTSRDNSRKTASGKNAFVLLTAEKNPTPQKICIDGNLTNATTVRWMKERKQIETSYTLFDSWATGGENSVYHFGKSQDWTNNGVSATGNLY